MFTKKIDRNFLKSNRWDEWRDGKTDQRQGAPPPPLQKPYPEGSQLIPLVPPEEISVGKMSLIEAIGRRRSRREYTNEPLTLDELSFLVWATQGMDKGATRELRGWMEAEGIQIADPPENMLRTVPSAGARHPFETYLVVQRVTGLEPGLYRYLPYEHKLLFLEKYEALETQIDMFFPLWIQRSAVIFLWTVIPYRTEWRYSILSPKLIAQDSGHICQNLYLASESIGAGACAVGGYDQDEMDALLGVDGEEEFTIYVAPVGKVDQSKSIHWRH